MRASKRFGAAWAPVVGLGVGFAFGYVSPLGGKARAQGSAGSAEPARAAEPTGVAARALSYAEMQQGSKPAIPAEVLASLEPGDALPEPYRTSNNAEFKGSAEDAKAYGYRNAVAVSAGWKSVGDGRTASALKARAGSEAGVADVDTLGVK